MLAGDWPKDLEAEFTKIKAEASNNNVVEVAKHPWMSELNKIFAGKDVEMPDGDEELEMTQVEVNTICPISRKEMRRPMKNQDCGHVYDKASIEALLSQSSQASRGWGRTAITKCPVVGCRSQEPITMAKLREDKETKRAIERNKN